MWASQLPQDLRLLRADESAAQNEAIANRIFQYQGYEIPLASPVATGILEREVPFGDLRLSQKLELLAGHSVLLSPGDKEAVRRFLTEGCWQGMSATDVQAIQTILTQALSPAQQTQMGLSIDDIRQITYIESLVGTRHEPMSETAAQMRDDLMAAHGISESEQRFRSSMHLIDVQADGVRVLADALLRSGKLTPQSSLQDIAEKSLSLVQTRFQYIKEPTDPDGTEQDRWQSIEETMRKGGGDCEDLAMLQASLLMNLMEQMGYSKKEIRDRVHISGGYMSDAAGNQKGHVLVRLQMNDGDLALDATGNTAPKRFDRINFDVVFEANDWKFNALQPIDPAFVTALDVTGSTADSIVSRINVVMTALKEQLKTRIDIPLPKTTFNKGAADFFGLGAEDVMQRDKADIYTDTEFSFFTLRYSTYSPPYVNNRLYLAEIKKDFFGDYINMTRNLTNQLLMLYHIGNSYLDFIANEATDIGMSGYDEQTKGAMQEVMESGDKYKGKIVGALNNYLQKSNDYIQKVASDVFGFVDSNNSAQLQMAQYKIDNWGRESLLTALPTAIVDELTNALQMVRIKKKVEVIEQVAQMAAQNMSAYVTYAKEMANGVRLWRIGTSNSEVTSLGALNFGEKVWEDMEGSTGAKSKYLAYLDKIQGQVTQIKKNMRASPTYSETYGLTASDMNKAPLEGELFGAHGDMNQFMQTNMDQMAKLLQHNVEFQNMVGIALFIRQTMQDAQRELAGSISGKKGTSSSGQVGGAALSALGAELAKQGTSLQLIQSGAVNLSAQATDLMTQRINYEKEGRTTIAKAAKLVVEIIGAVTGAVLGLTVGAITAGSFGLVSALPFLPAAVLGIGIPAYVAALTTATAFYLEMWSDYYERNTSNFASATAELAYSVVQYDSELRSKEVGTTKFIQEGNDFGRSENGASRSGAALAAAKQPNTGIWSDGEQKYYANRTSAKLLFARDAYNMQVNAPIGVGGGARASGPRNTQRTEFIADRGDGQVLLNGLLMGSREADASMLQGSVYALIGIFRSQRDAIENIISQAFGVQKAGKANAMGEQIGRSVGFEQQLLSIYKQDSQQRMQALNMLLAEDKRQRDCVKEMVKGASKLVIATAGFSNIPVPLPAPTFVLAKGIYLMAFGLIELANTAIEGADMLYKYDLGPYSANFAKYHERSLNASEETYTKGLQDAMKNPVPDAFALTTAKRYARLDQLENKQLAKMVDYGGGVGEWGSNLKDSILEYSNTTNEKVNLPFRQVNYGNASRVYNEITEIASLRIFYAMIEQALYQQKQNTLRLMVGTSSAAGHLNTMMQILDTYNSSILNGTYDSLLQEAGSRATSSNAFENNVVAKSIEYTVLGMTLLLNVPTLFRAAKILFGGKGYAGAQASAKALARGAAALKVAGAAAKMTFGFMLMYTVKGSNPTIDSTMASYDDDEYEKGDPNTKEVEDRKAKITRGSGGKEQVSSAEKTRAQILATRRERQITLMREIGLALDNATADAAEDVGGVSSSKSFTAITKIIGQFGAADRKQADFTYQALKQQADAYNRGIKSVVEGASVLVSMGVHALAEKLDTSKSDAAKANAVKGQTGTGGNSSNVRSTESKNAQSSEVRSKLYANLDKGLNFVITQALIESILWVLTMGVEKEWYEPFASYEESAHAKVEGNSEAKLGEGGDVASTDDLENAILGVALMQANLALLREIQADTIDLGSKMGTSPTGFLKKAIKGALPGAVKNRKLAALEKQEEKDLDDLADMDEDKFKQRYERFRNPQVDDAVQTTDNLAEKFDGILAETDARRAELRAELKENFDKDKSELDKKYEEKHGKDFLTSDDPNVQTAYKAELKGAKANALFKSDPSSSKDIVSDAMKHQPESFGPKGSGVWDVMTFAAKSLRKTMPDDQRQFLALQRHLGGGSAEAMYQALQDKRLAKATEEARKNVGSTTIVEAQAGMASKAGLVGARKQLSEVSKLEKMLENSLLQEIGVVDVGSLSDGDPGEADLKERKNKKENAKKDYLGEGSHLNEAFFNLTEKDQINALIAMGMSADDAAPLAAKMQEVKAALAQPDVARQKAAFVAIGVSLDNAAELVSDIQDLKELKEALRAVIQVGKVDDTDALKSARTTFKGTGLQLLRLGEDISKYVGSDQRLNAEFYGLSADKKAEALTQMGLPNTAAANGTQAFQDAKMETVAKQMAAIAKKQSTRLDSQDASLNKTAESLQSTLDKGADDLAVLAKDSKGHVSMDYIADDGSVKPLAEAPVGSTVSIVLMRAGSLVRQVVQVSKKALENLDFTKVETQATLAGLDGLGGGGDIALVSDIEGISQKDIFDKQKGMSRELSGVQKALSNLGAGGSAREMRTLQALGRMEKINFAREVETLGAELLRREGTVSISDLELQKDRKSAITEKLQKEGFVDTYGNVTEATKKKSEEDLCNAIENALGATLTREERTAVLAVLSGMKNQERKEAITTRLRDMQDVRPAERNALRKEIADLRSGKQPDGLDKLSSEAEQKLKDNHILNANGTLNAEEVARLQANPEDADRVFAAVAGIGGGALKAQILGLAKQEKLKKIEEQLEGMELEGLRAMRAIGLDPALTPSARIRLVANDANSDPNKVREILQTQAVAFREQALTEAEAKDNLEAPSMFSSAKPLASTRMLALARVGGAIVTAGATELAMGISNLNKSHDVKKAEKEKKKDLDRALAAKESKIDRVAAAKKFQKDVDLLVGVDANARVAVEFVDTYKKAVTNAKNSSKNAKTENKSTWARFKERKSVFTNDWQKMAQKSLDEKQEDLANKGISATILWGQAMVGLGWLADKTVGVVSSVVSDPVILAKSAEMEATSKKAEAVDATQTNVLKALVVERDAAVKLRKLVKDRHSGQAADILRYMAAGGSEGQALAAGVLRRLAANGDDVRDLVDRAAVGLSPDQLRGLGGAVVQAMGKDTRFSSFKLTPKDAGFDRELGALYGLSGWHTNTDADKQASGGWVLKWLGNKAYASVKSERGANVFADAMVGSKGFNKALASASEDDLATSLGNLPTARVSAVLAQLSEDAKPPSVAAASSGVSDVNEKQAFVKMAAAISGMESDGPDREKIQALKTSLLTYTVNPDVDKTIKAYTADLVFSLAFTVAAGLKPSFSETTVQSDYFKKLNEAVVRPGSEKGTAIDGTVTSLAEIAQKLKQDPVGAGAELENVKDRVATVIESAIGQGHVEDVLRVLAQLRQAGLSDLVKDLGALVALRGDGDLVLEALDARSESLFDTPEAKRSLTQQGYAAGLSDFRIGILDKDSRVADKIVQAQVDTAKKESALRQLAHKMVSGDVALVKAVLADSSLRQDLASLVAEGVALDMPSAYRILSLIGEKPQKEVALFAEAVGIRLAAVNVDIKTSSRKVDLKQMKETLTAMDKTGSKRKEIEAFAKQIEQGYGVQLYPSAPLRGLSREGRVQVLNTLVEQNKTQKATSIFRDLAMRNPQAAANLMTDALRATMPTLANTLYAAISKEIPGANGRTLTQIQSLIAAFSAEPEPLGVDVSSDYYGELLGLMREDFATIATAQRDLLFNSALSTMVTRGDDGTLSISEGQKPIALAQVQQEASLMYANLPSLMGQEDPNPEFTAAFTKIKDNPTSMTPDDFSTLTTLAGELPPTQARELRLLVGFAAMALPQACTLPDEMLHQQVLDMISVGQGSGFSAQMVVDALGSGGAGKLDALESLLKNNPDVLNLTKKSASSVADDNSVYGQIMAALKDPKVDPAQRRFLLQPGGALDRKVGQQLSALSMDAVIAFDQAQVSAGVSLSPSHFPKKLESEADKLDPPKGVAVKDAMTAVASGGKAMQAALTTLTEEGGDLAGTNLVTKENFAALQTLDVLGKLRDAMADLQIPTKEDAAKSEIQDFLGKSEPSAMLKAQQPYLYLSAIATTDVFEFEVTYGDAVNAYLSPTVTTETITNMKPLISDFMAKNPDAKAAMVLIVAADASLVRPRLPMLLENMHLSDEDTRGLAADLNALAGMAASTNLGASHVLSRAATVLREKLAVGSHAVLKDLAEKALRHHHKGQSYERELSSMSGHVHMHKAYFVDAMKVAPYNRAQDIAEKEVDKNASSEGGIPGMLTLLDAQDKALSGAGSAFAADAKTMKIAKMALAEVYIDTLIKDDTLSISGLDRQLATVLVGSLKEGMTQIMPRLKHRLKSSESTDRLMALIGQSNIPLEGDVGMGKLRAAVVKAADIFNMEDTSSATGTLGILQQDTDLAARTLSLYTDPKDAAAILNKLVAYQDDAAFAGGLLGRMPEPNCSGPDAQKYWDALFGALDFAKDVPSLAALGSGIQSPILKERFNVYLWKLRPPMSAEVATFAESHALPDDLNTSKKKAQLRIFVASTVGRPLSGVLPDSVKKDTMMMMSTRYADKALNEMMANPQARAMLGRLVAEDPEVRSKVADIVVAGQLPLSTLGGVLKLPGVAADLRATKLKEDPKGKLIAHMKTDNQGLLLAKVMVEPSLVGKLHKDDLGPLTNQLLIYGDPTGVLPHLMENPYSMAMIEAGLRETSPEISKEQAMQLVGLARSGQDLGTLLSAVPSENLASVLGSPTFLEGRSDKMAMLDAGISVMIKSLSAGLVSVEASVIPRALDGFNNLSQMLDTPTYGGLKGRPDMPMDGVPLDGVPKGVKLLIIKHMMAQGHEAKLDDRHVQSYESGFRPVLGSSENASWLGSLEAGKPDILLLQDALTAASRDPVELNALIIKLDAASKPELSAPNLVVDFLTTTLLGRSMMVRLNAMASTDSAVLEGLHTKLESANFDRLSSALNSAVTPEAFTHMAQSGVLLSDAQKNDLAAAFVVKYPAGSADAATALALLFKG